MNFIESIKVAFNSISVNKMRSFLTMLGIIIGISSVITITTIGNSLKQTLASTMNEIGGSNMIYASVYAQMPEDVDWDTWVYPDMTENDYITNEDIAEYEEKFSDKIEHILFSTNLAENVSYKNDNYSASASIMGISAGYLKSCKLEIIRGRDITDADNEQLRTSALVSDLFVKYALPENEEPIGKEISFSTPDGSTYNFVIAGVYEYNKTTLGNGNTNQPEKDIPTPVFIPAKTAYKLQETPFYGYEYLDIMTKSTTDPTLFAQETAEYFNTTVYATNKNFYVECQDVASQLSLINKVLDVITIAISVIAAISLIVGGVGVMNIMLVSIMERTKEIGIRKALGAKNSNIRMQFLTESVIICLIGGFIGITIGIANGYIIGFLVKTLGNSLAADYMSILTITVRPSIFAIIIAVGFSMLTGIVFGSYPASRAAKLSPIDALRYE